MKLRLRLLPALALVLTNHCENPSETADAANSADAPDAPDASAPSDGSARTDIGPRTDALKLIAPLSGARVTSRTPRLQWVAQDGAPVAEIQLCRDRACTMVIETLQATSSVRPSNALATGWVYWRVRTGAQQSPTWQFLVPTRDAPFGRDFSWGSALDVNGDGLGDLAVGAKEEGSTGEVYVYHGSPSGLSARPRTTIHGVAPGDKFGHRVASAGDVNGDGYVDLAVCANQSDLGFREGGALSIYHGSAMGVAAMPTVMIAGYASEDHFCASVLSAGDINHDGYADVLVGAPDASPGERLHVGAIYLYYGSAMGLNPSPSMILEGAVPASRLGFAIAALGDQNGDGSLEFAFSTPETSVGAAMMTGSVGLYTISPDAVPHLQQTLTGQNAADYFGFAIAGDGDLNGDGLVDLVVGVPGLDGPATTDVGGFSIYPGNSQGNITQSISIRGQNRAEQLGFALSISNDCNGDGLFDLAAATHPNPVDNPNGISSVQYFAGHEMLSMPTTPVLIMGVVAQDFFGSSLGFVADSNGDGFGELVSGAPSVTSPAPMRSVGTVSIYRCNAMGLALPAAQMYRGLAPGSLFGASVSP